MFKDDRGGVYEFPGRIISAISREFILVGYWSNAVPVILVLQDLLYPTRRPSDFYYVAKEAEEYLEKLIMSNLSEECRKYACLMVVDVRVFDAPFSLDQLPSVFAR